MAQKNLIKVLTNQAFSDIEIRTIQMLGDDYTRREIAETFKQSPRTVEARIYKLKGDLKFRTEVGLVMFFYRNGLIK